VRTEMTNAGFGPAAGTIKKFVAVDWLVASMRAFQIILTVLIYVFAALLIGVGIRALITGRAQPQDVQRFGSVRHFGLYSLRVGMMWALFSTGLLLGGRWVVALLFVMMFWLLLEVTRARRRRKGRSRRLQPTDVGQCHRAGPVGTRRLLRVSGTGAIPRDICRRGRPWRSPQGRSCRRVTELFTAPNAAGARDRSTSVRGSSHGATELFAASRH
jgi:hypothetical protein